MKILLVVDMQNDFITGSLGTKEAKQIVPNVAYKIKSENYDEILYTMDTHYDNYMETQEGVNLPVTHCIEGWEGWKINEEIQEALDSFDKEVKCFKKNTFGSVELAQYIKYCEKYKNLKEVEIIGLCTDICVVSNALLIKAFCPEIEITLDTGCCAGVTEEKHKAALETMRSCQIIIK